MSAIREAALNWFTFGSETEPAPPLPLRAGPLQLLFDPANGFLRRVSFGQREILRGIYAAVRDQNWGTIPGVIRETRHHWEPDSFHIEFTSEHHQGDIHFIWNGSILGTPDGLVQYDFDGEAKSTFLRNRIGFCVLHPIRECAGLPARQTRVDGSTVECRFPNTIEPQIFGRSSFRDLRAIAHEVEPGIWSEVEFGGDVFEMEDQRNWTDASFKTYCTPLTQPFPALIKAGTRIRQRVTLRLVGTATRACGVAMSHSRQQSEAITISVAESPNLPLPKIGLGMASHGQTLTEAETSRLRELKLAHLRVDVRLSEPNWPAVWKRAECEAAQLGVGLEVALHLPRAGNGGLEACGRCMQTNPRLLARVLALREGEAATTRETLASVRQALAGMDVPIGAGSDANFCELNREHALGHLALAEADFLFWPMNPQVHAFDNLSLMETLEAQGDTLRTARSFAGGKPLVISPVTLKPRFNAVATGAAASLPLGELPPSVDPRQLSLFAAAWTLGSLAALAAAGAESVTLFETTGWQGIMERECGSALPGKFPSHPGSVFPSFLVIASLAACNRIVPACVSAPSRVAALAMCRENGLCGMILGNLTTQSQIVQLLGVRSASEIRVLDGAAMQESMPLRFHQGKRFSSRKGTLTLNLPPCAIAFLEDGA